MTLPSHDTSAVPTLYRLHHELAEFHHPSYIFDSRTKRRNPYPPQQPQSPYRLRHVAQQQQLFASPHNVLARARPIKSESAGDSATDRPADLITVTHDTAVTSHAHAHLAISCPTLISLTDSAVLTIGPVVKA